MGDKMFLPAIDRAHYDQCMTWLSGVFGRQDGETLADLKQHLREAAALAAKGNDDEVKIVAVLAELGFCAVIDSMLETINNAQEPPHAH